MTRDPYQVLGVSRTAGQDDIRKAYRKLAKQYHPDRNPDNKKAEEKFKEINAAFDIVGDEEKRARFDRGEIDADGRERMDAFYRGAGGAEAGAGAGPGGFHFRTTGDFSGFEDLGDILSGMFGQGMERGGAGFGPSGRSGAPFQSKGTDIQYTLTVDFLDMANGASKRIELSDGGKLDVRIPAGIEEGQTMRLKGKGMAGLGGGPSGDALIKISVSPHKFFRREGRNIMLDLPITLEEAVLGAKVEVPTISGSVALTIPPDSNTGTTLRLKNRGIADDKTGTRGDQFVKLKIVMPDNKSNPAYQELKEFLKLGKNQEKANPRKGMIP